MNARFQYKVGDIIEQNTLMNTRRFVLVEARYDDIKNGLSGFDGKEMQLEPNGTWRKCAMVVGTGVWGYDYQVVRVVVKGGDT